MNTLQSPHLPLDGKRRGLVAEAVFVWVARLAVIIPLAALGWLLVDTLIDAWPRLSGTFLSGLPSRRAGEAGIYPALMGSLWLISLTAAVAMPLGVGAAIYLEEYGRTSRMAGVIEVAIANLAGVPSIIYGMLGLGVFVRFIGLGESILAGALTLAILVLPVIIMASREALRTVRDSLREAALGLGATRWRMIWHVILPMSLPGIFTGAILAISRAIGETAPLVLVGAVAFIRFAPDGIDAPYSALPIQVYDWASRPQKAFLVNAAAGIVVLVAALLVLNSIAIYLRNRYQQRA
ncbi:MAG: phosphate ABC transporter permease PstA [Kofleriaceae bacterium]|jgi:phosphate transport system permease protein|nr:phosphate ABC transporter permease PstA [Kofleriaceae bacterium]MBP6835709.1 phosphate ABC transporter permease PstA [Kofleriaceae bacterium]MBP9204962.1 phosphate ABC transporter permease PstA [Kofleriaceae bacterium]